MSAALASPSDPAVRRLPVLALLLGALLVTLGTRALTDRCADTLGVALGGRLVSALEPIGSVWATAQPDELQTDSSALGDAHWLAATTTPHSERSVRGAKHASKSTLVHAIHISSAQVLALAARRVMPTALPVKASAEHPAGLSLRSVSGLGVGLQDGDVLTEAAGQRASSVAAVIGLVLAARARHSSEISGRFFRAGVAYELSVEQPYEREPGF